MTLGSWLKALYFCVVLKISGRVGQVDIGTRVGKLQGANSVHSLREYAGHRVFMKFGVPLQGESELHYMGCCYYI